VATSPAAAAAAGPGYHSGMAIETVPSWAPTEQKLQAAVARLVEVAHPRWIILFGSRARGDADSKSDVDLLVVKRHVLNRYTESIQLDRALAGLTMPVEILVVSESEFETRATQPGTVENAALLEGRVLYGS